MSCMGSIISSFSGIPSTDSFVLDRRVMVTIRIWLEITPSMVSSLCFCLWLRWWNCYTLWGQPRKAWICSCIYSAELFRIRLVLPSCTWFPYFYLAYCILYLALSLEETHTAIWTSMNPSSYQPLEMWLVIFKLQIILTGQRCTSKTLLLPEQWLVSYGSYSYFKSYFVW